MEKNLYRSDFPQFQDKTFVYLDSAASALKPQSVIDSVNHYYHDLSVNIHRGIYDEAYEATRLYEETREMVASFINASPEEIVFTRGATSALNLVALSYGMNLTSEDEIITSELEHHSSVLPWQAVANKTKAKLVYIPLDSEGRITVEAFKSVLTKKTKIVAITYVSNVMGYISPLDEIIPLAHQFGARVVVDAAQAAPHLKIDVKRLDVDFLAFSGHKMLGPTGVGVLFGKQELLNSMEPIELGGEMNEEVGKFQSVWKDAPYKFEAGTMPIASIIGLAKAIEYLKNVNLEEIENHTKRIRNYAYQQLKKIDGIVIYNPTSDSSIIAFNIKNVHPHDAASYFAEKKVALRAGHHCAQLIIKWLQIEACLRASFYLYNTFEDADQLVQTAKAAVKFFRSVGFEG
ncbi:MAG: cysteine desulfurase [Tenericutes bacterium HGW-Tenericutes-1]|jgi:cysteine desulfurase/selenocysteine lyase|nr:MAG: cysteine desulfurase [Tenericutes bacterium HGW-Tenericutes-1]